MGIFGGKSGGAKSYRGMDGEDDMTEADWLKRGHEQAMAMREGGSWKDSNHDSSGTPTAGEYNGDYTDAQHDEANRKLDEDSDYATETEGIVGALFSFFRGERN